MVFPLCKKKCYLLKCQKVCFYSVFSSLKNTTREYTKCFSILFDMCIHIHTYKFKQNGIYLFSLFIILDTMSILSIFQKCYVLVYDVSIKCISMWVDERSFYVIHIYRYLSLYTIFCYSY